MRLLTDNSCVPNAPTRKQPDSVLTINVKRIVFVKAGMDQSEVALVRPSNDKPMAVTSVSLR